MITNKAHQLVNYIFYVKLFLIIIISSSSVCVSQIQDISVETEDNKEKKSAKDALLLWCQMKTAG